MTLSVLEAIRTAFEPLQQQFSLVEVEADESPQSTTVLYKNRTTGVEVTVDWGEFRPLIRILELYSLADDASTQVPDQADSIREFDAEWLLLLRGGMDSPAGKMFTSRSQEGVQRLLSRWADALQDVGYDVLEGDFAVAKRIDQAIQEQRRTLR